MERSLDRHQVTIHGDPVKHSAFTIQTNRPQSERTARERGWRAFRPHCVRVSLTISSWRSSLRSPSVRPSVPFDSSSFSRS